MAKRNLNPNDANAGYNPKPNGLRFVLIIVISCLVFLGAIVAVVVLLHRTASLGPHDKNKTPNSRLLLPGTASQVRVLA